MSSRTTNSNAVHHVFKAVLRHSAHRSASSPAWLATFLRKEPGVLLYFLIAVLLQPCGPWHTRGATDYGLAMESLRASRGRAIEGLDAGYRTVAVLIGPYVSSLVHATHRVNERPPDMRRPLTTIYFHVSRLA